MEVNSPPSPVLIQQVTLCATQVDPAVLQGKRIRQALPYKTDPASRYALPQFQDKSGSPPCQITNQKWGFQKIVNWKML